MRRSMSLPGTFHFYRDGARSTAEMAVEEFGDFAERLLGLRHPIIELVLGVRLALVYFELRIDAGVAKLTVHAHGIAQKQIACPGGQDRGREAVHISVDG